MRKLIIPIILISMLSAKPFDWFTNMFKPGGLFNPVVTQEQKERAFNKGYKASYYNPTYVTGISHVGPNGNQVITETKSLKREFFYTNKTVNSRYVDPEAPIHLGLDAYIQWLEDKHETSN